MSRTAGDVCRPPAAAPWRIQMMLDQAEGAEWVSRRNPAVRREIAALGGFSPEGIPHLAPEVQLFAKAHDTRPQDEQDFAAALPVLGAAQRRWLADALETTYGQHPWLGRL
ncbi:hypothetical protein AB0F52_24020 [Amycolatopsis sp. NPDC024027]|uniref:hypothetical protein n=1 Tax=Amycolatopsis sp. NPDC024027 TaxID=3154327 RepID=UPI0033D3804A